MRRDAAAYDGGYERSGSQGRRRNGVVWQAEVRITHGGCRSPEEDEPDSVYSGGGGFMNCSRTHYSRMVDYSAVIDGERKLANAIYQFVLGIRGRRSKPVSRKQILNWFHGTCESLVVRVANELVSDKLTSENGKFRVRTFRDNANERQTVLQHWTDQAFAALSKGQTMTEFVASCHIEHRGFARRGYEEAKKMQVEIRREIKDEMASHQRFGRSE